MEKIVLSSFMRDFGMEKDNYFPSNSLLVTDPKLKPLREHMEYIIAVTIAIVYNWHNVVELHEFKIDGNYIIEAMELRNLHVKEFCRLLRILVDDRNDSVGISQVKGALIDVSDEDLKTKIDNLIDEIDLFKKSTLHKQLAHLDIKYMRLEHHIELDVQKMEKFVGRLTNLMNEISGKYASLMVGYDFNRLIASSRRILDALKLDYYMELLIKHSRKADIDPRETSLAITGLIWLHYKYDWLYNVASNIKYYQKMCKELNTPEYPEWDDA